MHKEVESQNPIVHYFSQYGRVASHVQVQEMIPKIYCRLFNNKAYVNREDVTSTSITFHHHLLTTPQ